MNMIMHYTLIQMGIINLKKNLYEHKICSKVKEFLYYKVSMLMTFQRRQKGQKIDVDRKYSESFQRDLGTCYITAGPEEREN